MTFGNFAYFIRRAPASLALCLALALSACASATIEDAVPRASAVAADGPALPAGPIDTGTFPNLNIVPVGEAKQLTEDERAAKTAELQAARQTLAAEGDDAESSDIEPLKRLASTHGEDVLKQIEGD